MWRWIAFISSNLTLLWVFYAYRHGNFDDIIWSINREERSKRDKIRNWLSVAVAVALGALSCYAIIISPAAPKQLWWICLATSLTLVLIMVHMATGEYTASSQIAMLVITASMLVAPIMKLEDDNPHQIDRGVVIAHDFTPAHQSISCVKTCSTRYHPDNWALELRACDQPDVCVTGWLHFNSDVFGEYPIGSTYPSDDRPR